MPRSSACCLVTEVSAARQPDSEPICEKPTTLPLRSCAMAAVDKAVARPAARASLVMMLTMKSSQWPPGVFASGGEGTLYKVLLYVKSESLVAIELGDRAGKFFSFSDLARPLAGLIPHGASGRHAVRPPHFKDWVATGRGGAVPLCRRLRASSQRAGRTGRTFNALFPAGGKSGSCIGRALPLDTASPEGV